MKKFSLGILVFSSILILNSCANEHEKYIGKWTMDIGIVQYEINISDDAKCNYIAKGMGDVRKDTCQLDYENNTIKIGSDPTGKINLQNDKLIITQKGKLTLILTKQN